MIKRSKLLIITKRNQNVDAMKYKAFLFDLDGTLIDFDPNLFIKQYLDVASNYFLRVGLIEDKQLFIKTLLDATYTMEINDSPNIVLDDFLDAFCPKLGIDREETMQIFNDFYGSKFDVVKPLIKPAKGALKLLSYLKINRNQIKRAIATNPVFPKLAITRRMGWGNLALDDFDLITTGEMMTYAKLNPKYWRQTAELLDCNPSECLVVGNDALRDIINAKQAGCDTFLIHATLENGQDLDFKKDVDYEGSLLGLLELVKTDFE